MPQACMRSSRTAPTVPRAAGLGKEPGRTTKRSLHGPIRVRRLSLSHRLDLNPATRRQVPRAGVASCLVAGWAGRAWIRCMAVAYGGSKQVLVSRWGNSWLAVLVAGVLAACATPQARDIGGRWVPLNHFAETPQPIPLQQAYLFQATPVDGTLKSMLERWAEDSGRTLSYQHGYDYTLHAQAARVRGHDLATVVRNLTAAYAAEGIAVTADATRIVVAGTRNAPVASGDAPPAD